MRTLDVLGRSLVQKAAIIYIRDSWIICFRKRKVRWWISVQNISLAHVWNKHLRTLGLFSFLSPCVLGLDWYSSVWWQQRDVLWPYAEAEEKRLKETRQLMWEWNTTKRQWCLEPTVHYNVTGHFQMRRDVFFRSDLIWAVKKHSASVSLSPWNCAQSSLRHGWKQNLLPSLLHTAVLHCSGSWSSERDHVIRALVSCSWLNPPVRLAESWSQCPGSTQAHQT